MGIWLNYGTMAAVPQQVKASILAEADQLCPPHGWWVESLNFFNTDEDDGRLYGRTKTDLAGYSIGVGEYMEVDTNDNDLMAYRDMCFILEKLAEWSAKHGLGWEIEHAGEPIGMIEEGRWDPKLRGYLDGMKQFFPWPDAFDEKVRAISEKYKSRW